jgi:hypothetical protein
LINHAELFADMANEVAPEFHAACRVDDIEV